MKQFNILMMSKQSKILISVIMIAISIFTFLIGKNYQRDGFMDVNFSNLLTVFSQIFCASIIAFYLNSALTRKGRVRLLKVEAFDRLIKLLNALDENVYNYVNDEVSLKLRYKILSGFRDAQNEIVSIGEISELDEIEMFDEKHLKKLVIDYKASVTEGSFASDTPLFKWSDWLKINESFRKLTKEITKIRISNGT